MAVMFYSSVMFYSAVQTVPYTLSASFSLMMCAGDTPRPTAISSIMPVTFVMFPVR